VEREREREREGLERRKERWGVDKAAGVIAEYNTIQAYSSPLGPFLHPQDTQEHM
jgi:hypothetical protein